MVILVYNNKKIKFFYQDLINIALDAFQSIKKPDLYYLVLKITILSFESQFLLGIFHDPYFIVSIY